LSLPASPRAQSPVHPVRQEVSISNEGIQVISRAAAILRILADYPRGLSFADIAKAVDLPRSTVQRIVDALDGEGLVLSGTLSRGVRLGPAILPLAAGAKVEIAALVRSLLEDLSRASGETVDLSMFGDGKAVFIDQVQGSRRLCAVSAVGVAFPLHCSANGKAMLAALPPDRLAQLKKTLVLAANTENTVTDWTRLDAELASIARSGLAYDREEQSIGICALGTAVRTSQGHLIAVTIAAPTARFADRQEVFAEQLLDCRSRLLRLLADSRA